MAAVDLTAQRLRELLDYRHENGELFWRVYRGPRSKPGMLAGSKHPTGYVVVMVDGVSYGAHRLAWLHFYGCMPACQIDHINGVREDDRIVNLRDVSRAVNKQNIKRARCDSKASGLVGAFWHNQAKRWFSNISVGGVRKHIGMFDTAEEAHAAYIEAKRRLHPGCTI